MQSVIISKHHSVLRERLLDVVGTASLAGRARCWLPQEAARPSAHGDAPVLALPQLELPPLLHRAGARAGVAARVPAIFCCRHPCCCGVCSIPRNFI